MELRDAMDVVSDEHNTALREWEERKSKLERELHGALSEKVSVRKRPKTSSGGLAWGHLLYVVHMASAGVWWKPVECNLTCTSTYCHQGMFQQFDHKASYPQKSILYHTVGNLMPGVARQEGHGAAARARAYTLTLPVTGFQTCHL